MKHEHLTTVVCFLRAFKLCFLCHVSTKEGHNIVSERAFPKFYLFIIFSSSLLLGNNKKKTEERGGIWQS